MSDGSQHPENLKVTVTRQFAVTPERVFDAWVTPETIGQWMFGPAVRDEKIVILRTDARAGGKFSFVVDRQGDELDHNGIYLEFERPRRLAFTWAIGKHTDANTSRVLIEIRPQGTGDSGSAAAAGGCELTLTHEILPAWAAYAGRTENGWRIMLAALWNLLD